MVHGVFAPKRRANDKVLCHFNLHNEINQLYIFLEKIHSGIAANTLLLINSWTFLLLRAGASGVEVFWAMLKEILVEWLSNSIRAPSFSCNNMHRESSRMKWKMNDGVKGLNEGWMME